jgi:acyl-CoA thioester hydrolase
MYNANYLRLMQETAFDASAEAGYDEARYSAMQRTWLIHETDIEYLLPLHYNDSIEIKTWVVDFRRATSRRVYEFWNTRSGELAARAYTDWVFLDTTTNRPAKIPDEMGPAFFPDGLPETFPARKPFPTAPPAPAGTYRMRRRAVWQDIDQMRHVNNAVYLDYVTECGMQVVAAHGWPVSRMLDVGFGILLRRNQVQYLQPAILDDELEIATWFSNPRFAMATRHYEIKRASDGAILARVHALGVWVDLNSGRPIRIPKEMLEDFTSNMAAE